MPRIVRDFASRLRFRGRHYVFGLATHNGGPGLANLGLSRALSRAGAGLSAGFELLMPGNSVIIKDYTNPAAERRKRLERAEASLDSIAAAIRSREPRPARNRESPRGRLESMLTRAALKLYRLPRHFHADESCVGCGACAKVCPKTNISLAGKPVWGPDCERCLACFHWCPKGAIQIGAYTRDALRYHHPEVGFSELLPGSR